MEKVYDYSIDPNSNLLMHYGVLGMKWGIRKNGTIASPKISNLISRNRFDKMQHKSMVIVGSYHGEDSIKYFDKLLSIKKPKYFICESANGDKELSRKDILDKINNPPKNDPNYNKWVYELAYKHNCKIVGCDPKESPIKFNTTDEAFRWREKNMMKTIQKYRNKNAVVQLGDGHLRSIPTTNEFLKYQGLANIDDKGNKLDLTISNSSPIWETFKNQKNIGIVREPDEYKKEVDFYNIQNNKKPNHNKKGANFKMENELYHYGRKGMRWGIRKKRPSQNMTRPIQYRSDASLQDAIKRANIEKQYNKIYGQKSKIGAAKDIVDSTNRAANQIQNTLRSTRPKASRMDLSKMSDQELRQKINRENLEKQYNDMFNKPEVSRGRQNLQAALDVGTGLLTVGSSALAIALTVQQLRKGL